MKMVEAMEMEKNLNDTGMYDPNLDQSFFNNNQSLTFLRSSGALS